MVFISVGLTAEHSVMQEGFTESRTQTLIFGSFRPQLQALVYIQMNFQC